MYTSIKEVHQQDLTLRSVYMVPCYLRYRFYVRCDASNRLVSVLHSGSHSDSSNNIVAGML